MNSTAFSIMGFGIKWYGIMITTGAALGILLAKFNCVFRDISYDDIIDIVIVSLPIGIIGARLYYVVFEYQNYHSFFDVINIRGGGLAIHGGIIFGIAAALLYTWHKKINFLKAADSAVPSIILAQGIGRWGNFFNQEAHGGPVSYEFISHFPKFIQKGMYIGGVYYHPTFLYESLWDITVCIILIVLIRKSKKTGIVFFSYLGLYSIGRFFIEGMRTDSLMLGPIRVAQLISLLGVAVWILYLIIIRFFYKKNSL